MTPDPAAEPRYRTVEVSVTQYPFSSVVPLPACADCGAVVWQQDTHDAFHERLDATRSAASRAVSRTGLIR